MVIRLAEKLTDIGYLARTVSATNLFLKVKDSIYQQQRSLVDQLFTDPKFLPSSVFIFLVEAKKKKLGHFYFANPHIFPYFGYFYLFSSKPGLYLVIN